MGSPARCSNHSVTVAGFCRRAADSAAALDPLSPPAGQTARHEAHPFTPADRTPPSSGGTGRVGRWDGCDVYDEPVPWDRASVRAVLPEHLSVRPGPGPAVAPDRVGGPVRGLVALAHRVPDRGPRAVCRVGAPRHGQSAASLPDAHPRRAGRVSVPESIDATVTGDLVGDAHLRFRAEDVGTRVEATWTVEMRQPAMRAGQSGRPSRPAVGARSGGRDDRPQSASAVPVSGGGLTPDQS